MESPDRKEGFEESWDMVAGKFEKKVAKKAGERDGQMREGA